MNTIFFNEKEHKYYDANNTNYTSVTTLIGLYTSTYDTEFWAMYTALKEHHYKIKPVPEERAIFINNVKFSLKHLILDTRFKNWYDEIIARWKGITFEACERGNATHNELELSINNSKNDFNASTNNYISPIGKKVIHLQHELDNTPIASKYPEVYTRLSGYINNGFSIYAEKKVFLEKYRIAGMIDCPLLKQLHFCILDWKTNKDTITTKAGYYKKIKVQNKWIKSDTFIETGECFKYPLNNLEASKFNKMALQLSTYAFILEEWGYKLVPKGLEIIHFPVGQSPRLLKIPYLKNEVLLMLEHHKDNNFNTK